ncbi:HB21 protein, partial [Chaetops frenatus]|nr:HB21 protein [Chaetops frenatus]
PPELCPAHSGVFQQMGKAECQFLNGTEKVRLLERHFYNREVYIVYDSDVGHYVGLNSHGEFNAKRWNSDPAIMEQKRAEVDTVCRHNYEVVTPFSVER